MQQDLSQSLTEDYNKAIIEFCSDNNNSTIYLVGEISHPGISDLDFVIVNNKPVISDNIKKYLAGGNVLIIPDSHISDIKNIENLNLKFLQGKEYEIKPTSQQFKYVEILEWLPERILKCKSLLGNNNTSRQEVLLLHKSINRSIDNVQKITGLKYKKIETDEARKQKQKHFNKDKILLSSIESGNIAWQSFESFMIENNIIAGDSKGYFSFSQYYNCSNNYNSLLLYFKKVSNIKCKLSNILNTKSAIVTNNIKIDDEFDHFIIDRWLKISEIYEWFLAKNLEKGMIKYGWFL